MSIVRHRNGYAWGAVRAVGFVLLLFVIVAWLFLALGLLVLGWNGHQPSQVVSGFVLITALPALTSWWLLHLTRRGRPGATVRAVRASLHWLALRPLLVLMWLRAGGAGRVAEAAVAGAGRMGADLRVAPRTAWTEGCEVARATVLAYSERRAERVARRAAIQHARMYPPDGVVELPLPVGSVASTTRVRIWNVQDHFTAWAGLVFMTVWVAAFAIATLVTLLHPTLWTVGLGVVTALGATEVRGMFWTRPIDVCFERSVIRFTMLGRDLVAVPGDVFEIRREGSRTDDGDDRNMRVVMSGASLRVAWFGGIHELEGALKLWNPDAHMTGSWGG